VRDLLACWRRKIGNSQSESFFEDDPALFDVVHLEREMTGALKTERMVVEL
jgi:hypothetical protein